MANIEPRENLENPDNEGYLLHELQNAQIAQHDDDFEAEQRNEMPDAAFLRENIEEEIELEEVRPGKIGRGNQVWRQPERIRRTLNDNRETFGPTGIKIFHPSAKWTNQPLGDTVYELYSDIFVEYTKWTNVNIRKSWAILENEGKSIQKFMAEVSEDDIKKYFGTHLTQTLFKGQHMRLQEWIDKLPKTMAAWDRPDCYWIKRDRFHWIRAHLDCGENVKIEKRDKKGNVLYSNTRDPVTKERLPKRTLCLKTKFQKIYDLFNTISTAQKEPDNNFVALDESMRPSYSWKDPCKVYMAGKPIKVRIFSCFFNYLYEIVTIHIFYTDIHNLEVVPVILM